MNKEKEIRELVKLYFDFNPHNNRGVAFKSKAWDIISSYINTHNKTYDEIKTCIESNPMCQVPIWEQFRNYFNKKQEKTTNYKSSITDSTNPNDWI